MFEENINNSTSSTEVMDKFCSDDETYVSPFLYFFEYGVKAGIFKDLGEVEKLKVKNPLYSSFIDRWLADAIKDQTIKIETDGIITIPNKVNNYYELKGENALNKFKPISNTVTDQAIKQGRLDNKNLSTFNVFAIENTPELRAEYKEIVGDFYKKIIKLSQKVNNKSVDDINFVSISTCTIDKEVYSEI